MSWIIYHRLKRIDPARLLKLHPRGKLESYNFVMIVNSGRPAEADMRARVGESYTTGHPAGEISRHGRDRGRRLPLQYKYICDFVPCLCLCFTQSPQCA